MSRFSRVANAIPVDGVAARVIQEGCEYQKSLSRPEESLLPISGRGIPRRGVENLMGRKLGYWTVVGYLGKRKNQKGGVRWVVRCSCGVYSIRSAKAIRAQVAKKDCCSWCARTKRMRRWGTLKSYDDAKAACQIDKEGAQQ